MHPLSIIELFLLFQIKHFVADFPLQKPYQYLNKGKFLHPGGILHAAFHGAFTFGIVAAYTDPIMGVALGILDMQIHYFIDYFKVNINKKYGLTPTNSEYYWWLLGLDQFLHQLTYIGLIVLIYAK